MFDAELDDAASGDVKYAGKSLAERLAGRFYTPNVLADDLAERVAALLQRDAHQRNPRACLRVCDPFCGDGRLLVALLRTVSRWTKPPRVLATIQDIEGDAVNAARVSIADAAEMLGLRVKVQWTVGDSFCVAPKGQQHAVVTNPPWELLKPDTRETRKMKPAAVKAYRNWLRAKSDDLDQRFPSAKADVAWAGWGTNLARCGWDLGLELAGKSGVVGIVLPATIFSDQASASMRRSALKRAALTSIATFPPEARLFDKVDQPVITATFAPPPSEGLSASLVVYGEDRAKISETELVRTPQQLEVSGYTLPVGFGAGAADLLDLFDGFPEFRSLEGDGGADLWAGRELDETRLAEKLKGRGKYPFLKGRMIQRHSVIEQPSAYLTSELAKPFRSVDFDRVAWRDVSRTSQKRRMIGALVPRGWVTGNSLHVAYFRNGDLAKLRALHAVLSSFVFEFQVRTGLSTGHMSLGAVRRGRIPEFNSATTKRLDALAQQTLTDPLPSNEVRLEIAVAKAYGIGRDAFAALLDQFPKLQSEEKTLLLSRARWR